MNNMTTMIENELLQEHINKFGLKPQSIDGHFWVERDGKIIDPHFMEYDLICQIRGCNSNDKQYIKAPFITQFILSIVCKNLNHKQIGFGYCYKNAIEEIKKNGGTLCFGSMGFKNKLKSGYWWEYGGLYYKSPLAFCDFR